MGMIQQFQRADAQRRKEVAALGREVAATLGQFRKEDGERRREVATIKNEVATMRADAGAFVGRLRQVSADRRKEVAALVAEADAFVRRLQRISADRRKQAAAVHADVWGGAAPATRAAAPPAAAPPRKVRATLRDVIFTYLAEHPDGARLTQMEQDLGMARIKLAKEMKGLIDAKKVRKRDLVYFAA